MDELTLNCWKCATDLITTGYAAEDAFLFGIYRIMREYRKPKPNWRPPYCYDCLDNNTQFWAGWWSL